MSKYYLVGIFFVLIGSCVPIPKERSCCQIEQTPSLCFSDMSVGELPAQGWWYLYQDSQLDQLIERALTHHPSIDEALARVQKANAEAKIERSSLFPQVNFNADLNAQYLGSHDFFRAFAPGFPQQVTEYELDFTLTYNFDFWGKWRNLYRAAISETQAMIAESAEVCLVLSTAVAKAYFDLMAAEKGLKLLKQEEELIDAVALIRNKRFENGLDSRSALFAVQEQKLLVQQQVNFAEQNVEIQRHLLLNLIGEGPFTPLTLTFQKECLPTISIPQDLSSNLLARRPDLMADIWRVERAAYAVGAAKADFFPDVNLSALGGLDSVFFSKLFSSGSFTGSVVPALSLPIFSAGKIRANLLEKRSVFQVAVAQYNQDLLSAAKEVADGVTYLRTADKNLKNQEKVVWNRKNALFLAEERFENALGTSIELLEAKLELISQKIAQIEAYKLRSDASINLVKAIGGGYDGRE